MNDTQPRRILRVSPNVAGPFLRFPESRAEEIRAVLESHGVDHWFERGAVRVNKGPWMCVVNFGRAGDAAKVQAIIDQDGLNDHS